MPDGRDLVQRFVDGMSDYAIVVLDVHGEVVTWNAGARALFGYTAEEIVGRRLATLHSKSDYVLGKVDEALQDALQWGRHEATTALVRKGGDEVQVHLVLRPILDPGQRLLGFGLMVRDVGAAAKPADAEVGEPQAASGRILVVDDNPGILEEAAEQLTRLGYRVVSASDGAEALAVLERGEEIDLLFTDVVMPGEVAGRVLAEKAVQMRPGLKVLFASGYFEGALVSQGALETDVEFIAKPYRMKALAEKVGEILSAQR